MKWRQVILGVSSIVMYPGPAIHATPSSKDNYKHRTPLHDIIVLCMMHTCSKNAVPEPKL